MGERPEIELVRRARDALIQGGPEVLGEVLALDAQWYGVEDGQLCDSRQAIIDVMTSTVEETIVERLRHSVGVVRSEVPWLLPLTDGKRRATDVGVV